MAESGMDVHVVEIPLVDEGHLQPQGNENPVIYAIERHPLKEISESPGHLLLLKLWQREEDLFGRRISVKETRMDAARRQIFQLSSLFFIFYGFFLTILFSSSVGSNSHGCQKWWIPALVSGSTSLVIACLVHMEVFRYWKVWKQLQKERSDCRVLARYIQELRMKGASFDLSKEPLCGGKKLKSSSVEIQWKPLVWFSRNLITIVHVCFAGLVFPISKLILC